MLRTKIKIPPLGIEPRLSAPEADALSTELRERLVVRFYHDNKKIRKPVGFRILITMLIFLSLGNSGDEWHWGWRCSHCQSKQARQLNQVFVVQLA